MGMLVQVVEVERPLFAVRDIKAAGNATLFGPDSNHAVINKNKGRIICEGGKDVVLDQVTRKYQQTNINDTDKEYTIDMWVQNKQWKPKVEYVDPELDKTKKKFCLGDYILVDKKATFRRHP